MKILYSSFCANPARELREALEEIMKENIHLTNNPERIIVGDKFIRYGNALPVRAEETNYNSPEFIKLAGNKGAFSLLMKEGGIYSPYFHSVRNEPNPDNFPLLLREKLNSSGGKGIHTAENIDEYNNLIHPTPSTWSQISWWTPYIFTEFELRVHVLGGIPVKVFKKEWHGEGEESKLPVRNMHLGYHFSLKELDTYKKIPGLVEKVDELLKGKFYTLDIGWDKKKKQYLVYEANSASGLNQNTAQLYAEYLVKELGG